MHSALQIYWIIEVLRRVFCTSTITVEFVSSLKMSTISRQCFFILKLDQILITINIIVNISTQLKLNMGSLRRHHLVAVINTSEYSGTIRVVFRCHPGGCGCIKTILYTKENLRGKVWISSCVVYSSYTEWALVLCRPWIPVAAYLARV